MPIFSKRSTSKPEPRLSRLPQCPKVDEDLNDFRNISMNIGGRELKFVDGSWINLEGSKKGEDVSKLKAKALTLEEENNLNKIKVEVLLDMLAENVAQASSKNKSA